jgi:hypothetical protein
MSAVRQDETEDNALGKSWMWGCTKIVPIVPIVLLTYKTGT